MTTIDDILTLIAKHHLQIDTNVTGQDQTAKVPICAIKSALETAFKAGAELGVGVTIGLESAWHR